MSREFMCQYGNCTFTAASLPITVTVDNGVAGKERPRFCCQRHAAMWLFNAADREEPHTAPPGYQGSPGAAARAAAWGKYHSV